MAKNQSSSDPFDYVLALLEQGFTLDFIARDCQCEMKSLVRRFDRNIKAGNVSAYHIDLYKRKLAANAHL